LRRETGQNRIENSRCGESDTSSGGLCPRFFPAVRCLTTGWRALLRLKELETLEKVTEKIGNLTVYDGLEGVLKNMVPRLS